MNDEAMPQTIQIRMTISILFPHVSEGDLNEA